jgi:hypothetical protein
MRAVAYVLPMLLVACGGGAAPVPQPTFTGPSDFQKQVAALSPAQQRIVMIRAIRDAAIDCQNVTEARRVRDMPSGEQLYVAQCVDGASYGVLMGRDGTAKVLRRGA